MTPYDLFISTAEVPFDWGDARPAADLGGDAAFPGAPIHDGSPGPSKGANPGTGEPPHLPFYLPNEHLVLTDFSVSVFLFNKWFLPIQ